MCERDDLLIEIVKDTREFFSSTGFIETVPVPKDWRKSETSFQCYFNTSLGKINLNPDRTYGHLFTTGMRFEWQTKNSFGVHGPAGYYVCEIDKPNSIEKMREHFINNWIKDWNWHLQFLGWRMKFKYRCMFELHLIKEITTSLKKLVSNGKHGNNERISCESVTRFTDQNWRRI